MKLQATMSPLAGTFSKRPIQEQNWSNTFTGTVKFIDFVSDTIITDINPEEGLGTRLSLYPNPCKGRFSIDWRDEDQFVTLTLTDLNGKLLQSGLL